MKAKDVLGKCLEKMGQTNFLNNTPYSTEQQELVNKLLASLNIIYLGDVCEQLPMVYEETVTVSNNQILASSLTKTILHPIRLTDGDNIKHRYKIYPEYLKTDFDGSATLEYSYLPSTLSLSSDISNIRLTVDMLSDGTLAQYYFALRVFDLASSYDSDFRLKLSNAKYKGQEISIKERRWGA